MLGRQEPFPQRCRGLNYRALLDVPDFYPKEKYGRDHTVAARFYWLRKKGLLVYAPLVWRGDNEHSLCINAWATPEEQCEFAQGDVNGGISKQGIYLAWVLANRHGRR